MRKNSGLAYALKYAGEVLKQGIGTSKREIYKENGGRSPVIHSYSTYNRYMGIAKEFINFAKANEVRKVNRLDSGIVDKFIKEKIDRGYTEKTIKVNISALEKFFKAIERSDLAGYIRDNYVAYYEKAGANGRALAFGEPERVIESLKQDVNKAIATIQLLTGARIGDVKKMEIKGDKVYIDKSKGGKSRTIDFTGKRGELERVKEAKMILDKEIKNRGWGNIRKEYYADLKQACKKAGEIYTGAHSFRVNFTQNRVNELGQDVNSLRKVSEELGHNRVSITRYYYNG